MPALPAVAVEVGTGDETGSYLALARSDVSHRQRPAPPRMFLEELEELPSFKGCRLRRTGFAFYSAGTAH